jgi:hypothetical protein
MGGCEGGLPKSPYGGDLKDNKYTALRFGGGADAQGREKMKFEAQNGIINLSVEEIIKLEDGWDVIVRINDTAGTATIKRCEDGVLGAHWPGCNSASKWVSKPLYQAIWETGDFVEVLEIIEKMAVKALAFWMNQEVVQARKALDAAKTRLSGLKHALEEIWQWSREAIKPNHYPRVRRVQALMSVYNKIEKAEEVLEEAEEKYQKAYKTYARSRFF